jgi:coenzyme F420-reducing hydrogenase gamma subunit
MAKPKLALYWAASCGGCEITVVDIEEKILDVADFFDIVLWPCVMDFKYEDVEAMEDGEILITLFNGAIRNSENEYMAKLLRQKSKLLIAFGNRPLIMFIKIRQVWKKVQKESTRSQKQKCPKVRLPSRNFGIL